MSEIRNERPTQARQQGRQRLSVYAPWLSARPSRLRDMRVPCRLFLVASDEPIDARAHCLQGLQRHAIAAGRLEEQYLLDPRRKGDGALGRSWNRPGNLLSSEDLPTRQTMPAPGKLWFGVLIDR